MFNMNKLSTAKRVQIVKALVEGNSLRSVTRMVGVSINTVTKLLVDLGTACEAFHDEHVRNVSCRRVQADEIWSFCYARNANVPEEYKGVFGYGDLWTWVGQCADSKMVLSWRRGGLKGGRARAEKLTKEQRRESALKAARARWDAKR
jgi:hypothetical protein